MKHITATLKTKHQQQAANKQRITHIHHEIQSTKILHIRSFIKVRTIKIKTGKRNQARDIDREREGRRREEKHRNLIYY